LKKLFDKLGKLNPGADSNLLESSTRRVWPAGQLIQSCTDHWDSFARPQPNNERRYYRLTNGIGV